MTTDYKSNLLIRCVGCNKDRLLNWSEIYKQFLCPGCIGRLPVRGRAYLRAKKRLYARQDALRRGGVKKWWRRLLRGRVKMG